VPAPPYLELAAGQVPRLLSCLDRETPSLTYGCFDRTFWCWKFTDFPGARYQEGVFALAFFYAHETPALELFGDPRVLEWSRAALRYWCSIQYGDGSFDEAYPFEHSLAASAFSAFYVGEAVRILRDGLPPEDREAIKHAFQRVGDWLASNDEQHGVLSNHLAAAAAACLTTFAITGDERHRARCDHFLGRIYERQDPVEGWYEEYGGPDIGYQTHAMTYLAHVWRRTGDRRLLQSLRRATEFLQHFVHPGGSLGGEYASRNTEFLFPAAVEALAPDLPSAAALSVRLRPVVARQRTVGLAAMDAQNLFPMLNNYLLAGAAASTAQSMPALSPAEREPRRRRVFLRAGLVVHESHGGYAVVGLAKGGVVKAYDARGVLVGLDCGYWARAECGRLRRSRTVITSQGLLGPGAWRRVDETTFEVESPFVELNQRLFDPWLFLAFRSFTLSLGRLRAPALWLKRTLVQTLVSRRRPAPVLLRRRVVCDPDGLWLRDTLELRDRRYRVSECRRAEKFSSIHMGSARYFQFEELEVQPSAPEDLAVRLARDGVAVLERRISFTTDTSGQAGRR